MPEHQQSHQSSTAYHFHTITARGTSDFEERSYPVSILDRCSPRAWLIRARSRKFAECTVCSAGRGTGAPQAGTLVCCRGRTKGRSPDEWFLRAAANGVLSRWGRPGRWLWLIEYTVFRYWYVIDSRREGVRCIIATMKKRKYGFGNFHSTSQLGFWLGESSMKYNVYRWM